MEQLGLDKLVVVMKKAHGMNPLLVTQAEDVIMQASMQASMQHLVCLPMLGKLQTVV